MGASVAFIGHGSNPVFTSEASVMEASGSTPKKNRPISISKPSSYGCDASTAASSYSSHVVVIKVGTYNGDDGGASGAPAWWDSGADPARAGRDSKGSSNLGLVDSGGVGGRDLGAFRLPDGCYTGTGRRNTLPMSLSEVSLQRRRAYTDTVAARYTVLPESSETRNMDTLTSYAWSSF